MDNYVYIFDTTLRDGEQSPGCSMNVQEKLQVARILDELGVDIIEAGFPAASEGDFAAVKSIAEMGLSSRIAGLARAFQRDIEAVARSLENSPHKRLHTFIATSPIHREFKLKMSKQQIIDEMCGAMEFGKQWFDEIEVSAEDACRTELDYLVEFFQAAVDAGARVLNVPDTVGYTTPREARRMFRYIVDNLRNADHAILSCHNHNDLGLAVANSLAAVEGGARQIECTLNGIGERAGNCALEEIVMAVRTRGDFFDLETGLDTTQIVPTSRLVSQITGFVVQPNKAVVGANAFAHASGIHQDGVIKKRETYEIIDPVDVGVTESSIVLTARSGRAALAYRAKKVGYELTKLQLDKVYEQFLQFADRKKEILDEDIHAIVEASDVNIESIAR